MCVCVCVINNHIMHILIKIHLKELNKPVVSDGASLPCGNKV